MVLKLTNRQGFTRLERLSVLFYVLVEVNADLFSHRLVYIAAVALLSVAIIPHIELKRIKNRSFVQWAIPWILIVAISIIYSIVPSQSVTSVFTLGARFLVMLLLIQRVNGDEQLLRELIKIVIVAQLINTIYILSAVDLSVLGSERLGKSIDEKWNANSIGITLAYTCFAIFLLLYNKILEKKLERVFLFMCLALFAMIVLFTGSRKALFILVFSILLYYLLSADFFGLLPRMLLIAFLLVVAWWLLMNVEPLYNVLGARVERLVNIFFGNNVKDVSVESRGRLIQMGIEWIKQKPILGYGMNTFDYMCGNATGQYWYSHNNFIEVAFGTGLIGLIAYYWIFVRFIKRAIGRRIDNWRIVLTLAAVILINDYGTVSYKMFTVQFCIMIMLILVEKRTNLSVMKEVN